MKYANRINKRRMVYEKYSGRCAYCGEVINFEDFHIDHIIPKSQKGSNRINNLLPTCCRCNLTKGTLNIEEYRVKIYHLPDTNALSLFVKYYEIKRIPIIFYFEKV